jgi:hypothetical protein
MEETTAPAPLDTALGKFMAITAKSTVAVIIPLYGYWNDIPDNPADDEAFYTVMSRILPQRGQASIHQLILVFVAHPQSIPHDPKNPRSIGNLLLGYKAAGNTIEVAVERDATYPEYIKEGMDAVLDSTKASFVIVLNPWVLIQEGAIDVLVDRVNFGDNAKIVSGFNMKSAIQPEELDKFRTNMPTEEWDLSLNFLGMPRYVAEMLKLDTGMKTHKFFERDIWQRMFSTGFDVITTQRLPIFPFDFPWTSYETKEQFDEDRQLFLKKWKFDIDAKYTDD